MSASEKPRRRRRSRPLVVALRALGLGDFLTTLPALRAVRDAFPEHTLVLAAPAELRPLALHTGAVDGVVHTLPLQPLPSALAGAELAVNLHGRGPESHRVLLASRPRRVLAFAHEQIPASRAMPRWCDEEHEVLRWCRLLAESRIPADPRRLDLAPPARSVAAHASGATLIHPGASSAARRWPAERYAAVARAEREAGRAVIITGGRVEVELARGIAREAGLPDDAVWAGRTDILDLAALVARASRVLCGDTGVAHLATALATPSVVLFGPTSPAEWGPPPERSWHRPIWKGRAGDPHADRPDPGLLAIEPEEVLAALAELSPAQRATPAGSVPG